MSQFVLLVAIDHYGDPSQSAQSGHETCVPDGNVAAALAAAERLLEAGVPAEHIRVLTQPIVGVPALRADGAEPRSEPADKGSILAAYEQLVAWSAGAGGARGSFVFFGRGGRTSADKLEVHPCDYGDGSNALVFADFRDRTLGVRDLGTIQAFARTYIDFGSWGDDEDGGPTDVEVTDPARPVPSSPGGQTGCPGCCSCCCCCCCKKDHDETGEVPIYPDGPDGPDIGDIIITPIEIDSSHGMTACGGGTDYRGSLFDLTYPGTGSSGIAVFTHGHAGKPCDHTQKFNEFGMCREYFFWGSGRPAWPAGNFTLTPVTPGGSCEVKSNHSGWDIWKWDDFDGAADVSGNDLPTPPSGTSPDRMYRLYYKPVGNSTYAPHDVFVLFEADAGAGYAKLTWWATTGELSDAKRIPSEAVDGISFVYLTSLPSGYGGLSLKKMAIDPTGG